MSDSADVGARIQALLAEAERDGLKLVITEVRRYPDCQVYGWNSAAAAAGNTDPSDQVAGGGPFIVDNSGNIWETGSAYSIETLLADFRGPRSLVRLLRNA